MRRALVLTGLLTSAACAGPPFVLSATAETFCHQLPEQRFVVPQGAVLPQAVSIARTFEFDVSQAPAAPGLTARLGLAHVRLTRTDGTLDFLKSAQVTLLSPSASALESPSLATGRIPTGATAIRVAGQDVDLAPYLANGLLRYAVALEGTMPARSFSLDLEACATVSATLDTVALINATVP